jgi:hypothetical protein
LQKLDKIDLADAGHKIGHKKRSYTITEKKQPNGLGASQVLAASSKMGSPAGGFSSGCAAPSAHLSLIDRNQLWRDQRPLSQGFGIHLLPKKQPFRTVLVGGKDVLSLKAETPWSRVDSQNSSA